MAKTFDVILKVKEEPDTVTTSEMKTSIEDVFAMEGFIVEVVSVLEEN